MGETSGVYPCYENQFQINTAASGATASMASIADCETFEVSFDNGVEEWTPFDTEGWIRRLMTAKASYDYSNCQKKRRRCRKRCSSKSCMEKRKKCGKRFSVDIPGRNSCKTSGFCNQCYEYWCRRFYSGCTAGI